MVVRSFPIPFAEILFVLDLWRGKCLRVGAGVLHSRRVFLQYLAWVSRLWLRLRLWTASPRCIFRGIGISQLGLGAVRWRSSIFSRSRFAHTFPRAWGIARLVAILSRACTVRPCLSRNKKFKDSSYEVRGEVARVQCEDLVFSAMRFQDGSHVFLWCIYCVFLVKFDFKMGHTFGAQDCGFFKMGHTGASTSFCCDTCSNSICQLGSHSCAGLLALEK